MNAYLRFVLPEDKNEFILASNAQEYYSVLWDISQTIRSKLKHGHDFKSPEEALEWIQSFICERVNLDEVD